ncbi:hypothetical protein E6H31_09525 [Candidatus Bathyarchaeota archaeon]|nr:MAG: hypothetical protein E6H31_09525 [Candidatus Bathyarchaeota archaeon]
MSAPSSSSAITIVNTTASFIIRDLQVSPAVRGIFLSNVTGGTSQSTMVSQKQYGVMLVHSGQVKVSNNSISQ